MPDRDSCGLSSTAFALKCGFDFVVAALGLLLTWWIILLAAAAAWIDTGESGFFTQLRVGRHGRLFPIIKIRTMRSTAGGGTNVTTSADPRITRFGRLLRKTKLDELPQLINVLLGHMSLVGPRPDVPGFADRLTGEDRCILSVRPGITGPAALMFRDEESLLAGQSDPERYNAEVIYPQKVEVNKRYVREYSFRADLGYLYRSIFN